MKRRRINVGQFETVAKSGRWLRRTQMSVLPIPEIKLQLTKQEQNRYHQIGKPYGFWYQTGRSWEEWIAGERMLDWMKPYLVVIEVDPSRILQLRSAYELHQFTEQYKAPFVPGQTVFESGRLTAINWQRVAESWGGIEISPYQWSCRFDLMWYYGWDCASGCVWDLNAVRVVKPGVPRKPLAAELVKEEK